MPVLMRRQPQAPVFMTEATRQLSDVMLHNSVNVMMKKRDDGIADYPLFTHREVDVAFRRWRPIPLHTRFDVTGERIPLGEDAGLSLEFFDAGHILGSVGTLIRAHGRQIFLHGRRAVRRPDDHARGAVPRGATGRADRRDHARGSCDAARLYARWRGVALRAGDQGGLRSPAPGCSSRFSRPRQDAGDPRDVLRNSGATDSSASVPSISAASGRSCRKSTTSSPSKSRGNTGTCSFSMTVAPFTMAGRAAEATPLKGGRLYALSSGYDDREDALQRVRPAGHQQSRARPLFRRLRRSRVPRRTPPPGASGRDRTTQPDVPPQPLNCEVEQFNFSAHATRETLRAYVNKVRPKKNRAGARRCGGHRVVPQHAGRRPSEQRDPAPDSGGAAGAVAVRFHGSAGRNGTHGMACLLFFTCLR